ncbi:REP-associated tyrosine transposase [Hymenobacter metallilatus]|uniref:Transposase n=1 Tax=Hymenobacter metallilatus TaxID=2493666 RepID=A0A3R9MZC7_9BACT|nr:transposase [Hymenobacter metallilatus]RSK34570.1 transposase [Hymenobacter metallilatus]
MAFTPADPAFYQRNLPHMLPPGGSVFITIRLAGSLPAAVVEQLREQWQSLATDEASEEESYARQKRYFGRFDRLLDAQAYGPTWLRQPAIATLVQNALQHYNGRCYELLCYCLMPNHVHVLLRLPDDAPPLLRTLQSFKSYTATQANKLLQRTGQFWQRESYDHLVRNTTEFDNIIRYILENPVKAGLVSDWEQWPYSFCQ